MISAHNEHWELISQNANKKNTYAHKRDKILIGIIFLPEKAGNKNMLMHYI